jgi:hypothetical protein
MAAGRPQSASAAPAVDIMEALKKSLAAARKPPNRAQPPDAVWRPSARLLVKGDFTTAIGFS